MWPSRLIKAKMTNQPVQPNYEDKVYPAKLRNLLRLQGYDYSQAGAYFVTICTQNRFCLFGEVIEGQTRLNSAGLDIEKWWQEIGNKYPEIEKDEFVIMPNHLHGIIAVTGKAQQGRPHRAAPTLTDIMDWFKTMTTNAYIKGVKDKGWSPFPGRLWQRGYYERVIRNEKELDLVREYIFNNPMQWHLDKDNPEVTG